MNSSGGRSQPGATPAMGVYAECFTEYGVEQTFAGGGGHG